MFPRCITEPLDAVGQDGNGRIVDRRSFHRPPGIPDHDLVERETLLRAPDEDMAPDFWNFDHDPRLTEPKLVGRQVVEESAGPGYGSVCLDTTAEQDPG